VAVRSRVELEAAAASAPATPGARTHPSVSDIRPSSASTRNCSGGRRYSSIRRRVIDALTRKRVGIAAVGEVPQGRRDAPGDEPGMDRDDQARRSRRRHPPVALTCGDDRRAAEPCRVDKHSASAMRPTARGAWTNARRGPGRVADGHGSVAQGCPGGREAVEPDDGLAAADGVAVSNPPRRPRRSRAPE
jgi:hypothetical protein